MNQIKRMAVVNEIGKASEEREQDLPSPADDSHTPAVVEEVQRFVSRADFTVRHTSSAHCEFGEHSHAAYTVTAILSGRLEATIGTNDVELTAGQVALTNIGQSHSARGFNVEFVSVGISAELVGELVVEMGLARATSEIVFLASAVTDETITAMARAIADEMDAEKPGHGAMLDAIARQLVIHLLRSYLTVRRSSQVELSRAGPVDRRLRRAIEFMHDNYGRELALEEIASAAYLSEYHFARLFKQITGQTPHGYLANLRIERARRLLAETRLSISEVAATVGYQSQSHFTKVFKSVTGVTPRTYRLSATLR